MKNAILGASLALVFCAVAAAQSTQPKRCSTVSAQMQMTAPCRRAAGFLMRRATFSASLLLAGVFGQPNGGCGTVFELSPSATGWIENILYNFCTTGDACSDGANPAGRIYERLHW